MNNRPSFVTQEDLVRWDQSIESDERIPKYFTDMPELREVCYAGLYLGEQLEKLECPEALIVRIQYSAGKSSFGNDVWEVHLSVLEKYKNSELEIEDDGMSLN